jgi:hypothetical protein
MMPATSNPARSGGRHNMEGRGCGPIVFAPARLPSWPGPVRASGRGSRYLMSRTLLVIASDPGRAS